MYESFDPAGIMSVDKGPLAFWVQALSVKLAGFHPRSVLMPQALMGIGSVTLVYSLTRRVFGRAAGAIAGFALAVTPILRAAYTPRAGLTPEAASLGQLYDCSGKAAALRTGR